MPGYTDFDTWFHEQEGTSLRSERFNGDVEWLKAAFDAGRSAHPSLPAGHVAVPVERLTTVLDEYDAKTKALPFGHEDRTRGASSYNWRRSVVDDIRAMLAALPHSQGEGK